MIAGFFTSEDLRRGELPDCGVCGLYRDCGSPKMLVSGCGSNGILVVGEAPGGEEDAAGRPFVGKAGKYLRGVFQDNGVDLDDCWITNSIICRPPSNVMAEKYLQACKPSLSRTVRELKPRIIITLGEWALRSLLPEIYQKFGGPMKKWRGWTIPYSQFGAWICPIYHPSYILRSENDPVLDVIFRQDIGRALAKLEEDKFPSFAKTEESVEVLLWYDEARTRLAWLADQEGILAFDYETTSLKPEIPGAEIVSCAFCLNGQNTFAHLVSESHYSVLSRILKSTKLRKVASNLKFEERWTRAVLGHGVARWYWDTMQAAHFCDNRSSISSVKFQAFVLLGVPPWDDEVEPYIRSGESGLNRMKEAPAAELLRYNGLDALFEYRVMEAQKLQMGIVHES